MAWQISHGKLSHSPPIISSVKGNAMPFGFSFISENAIFVADPSFGASILNLNQYRDITEHARITISNQTATCWTQYSLTLNELYSFDAGVDKMSTIDASTGLLKSPIPVQTDRNLMNAGLLDSAIKDGNLYSLAKANGITAVDLRRKRQIQFFDLSAFGDRHYYQGLALWPSSW